MAESVEYGMIFRFSDQSPKFAYGFMCGKIWSELENYSEPFERSVLNKLVPEIARMATGFGIIPITKQLTDEWSSMEFSK